MFKNIHIWVSATLSLVVALGLTSCSKSMVTQTAPGGEAAPTTDNSGAGGNTEQTTPDQTTNPWSSVSTGVNGKVDGSAFNGQLLIQVDSANQALIFYLPIPIEGLIGLPVTAIEIPQLPGVTVFQVVKPDGSSQLAIRVPLKYMLRGAELVAYNALPNGDPLPFMPAGENRGFAITLPGNQDLRLHFYLAANAAAVFIELPQLVLPEPWARLSIGFPIRNADKTQVVGYFQFVPNKSTFASGVYIAGRIPTQLATVIDNLIRY